MYLEMRRPGISQEHSAGRRRLREADKLLSGPFWRDATERDLTLHLCGITSGPRGENITCHSVVFELLRSGLKTEVSRVCVLSVRSNRVLEWLMSSVIAFEITVRKDCFPRIIPILGHSSISRANSDEDKTKNSLLRDTSTKHKATCLQNGLI